MTRYHAFIANMDISGYTRIDSYDRLHIIGTQFVAQLAGPQYATKFMQISDFTIDLKTADVVKNRYFNDVRLSADVGTMGNAQKHKLVAFLKCIFNLRGQSWINDCFKDVLELYAIYEDSCHNKENTAFGQTGYLHWYGFTENQMKEINNIYAKYKTNYGIQII